MRVKEAAARLDIGIKTVYGLVSAGKLGCHRVGMGRGCIRISEEHLVEFLKQAEWRPAATPPPIAPKPPKLKLRHLRLP